MKYELVVVADPNDADYITNIQEITEEELQELLPIIKQLRKGRHNWPASEYGRDGTVQEMYPELTEEQIEFFSDFIPYGEYGIHTIESIVYYPVPNKIKLL